MPKYRWVLFYRCIMLSFNEWLLQEDGPTNCSAGPAVRGFGDTSGTPDGSSSTYIPGNIADSDNKSSQLFHAVNHHLSMHGHTTPIKADHSSINLKAPKGIKAPNGVSLPGVETHLMPQ